MLNIGIVQYANWENEIVNSLMHSPAYLGNQIKLMKHQKIKGNNKNPKNDIIILGKYRGGLLTGGRFKP